MGIPVVAVILVFLHHILKSAAVVIALEGSNILVSGADGLIVDLDIFCLRAGLVNFEDAVRIIFTGEGGGLLIVLN